MNLKPFRRRQAQEDRKRRFSRPGISIAASLFFASCQDDGRVTVDLVTEPPANSALQQVVVPLLGVEFRRSDGTTERFEFRRSEPLDLANRFGNDTLRLLSKEELPTGNYTGVRLLFDTRNADDAFVIDQIGAQRTLTLVSGEYAPISLNIEEDESSDDKLTLTLDARLSLSETDDNKFQFEPFLRSVRTEDAAELSGLVNLTDRCIGNGSIANEPAVYLFRGEAVTPDDFDGQEAEPFATAPVLNALGGNPSYELRFLPAGTYTLALACAGQEENPSTDDDLAFDRTVNVEIEEGESVRQDISAR